MGSRDDLPHAVRDWLGAHAGIPADVEITPLAGGNANAAYQLRWAGRTAFLRTPPADAIDPTAHNLAREHRLLQALSATGVPAPQPLALCAEKEVPRAPFLLMEHIDGVSITEALPPAYDLDTEAVRRVAEDLIDALAAIHAVDWHRVGLDDFGRPEGFLARQVPRWRAQRERHRVRALPQFERVAEALTARLPAEGEATLMHGDFHLDNTLYARDEPRLLAVIDWEMATIGDPLLDLGLCLAFWGERSIDPCAMPSIQAVSRRPGAPTRGELAERYAQRTGRSVAHLEAYMALAFFKLAAIVEGAYALHLRGELTSAYAARLEHDVPRLLDEAERFLSG